MCCFKRLCRSVLLPQAGIVNRGYTTRSASETEAAPQMRVALRDSRATTIIGCTQRYSIALLLNLPPDAAVARTAIAPTWKTSRVSDYPATRLRLLA